MVSFSNPSGRESSTQCHGNSNNQSSHCHERICIPSSCYSQLTDNDLYWKTYSGPKITCCQDQLFKMQKLFHCHNFRNNNYWANLKQINRYLELHIQYIYLKSSIVTIAYFPCQELKVSHHRTAMFFAVQNFTGWNIGVRELENRASNSGKAAARATVCILKFTQPTFISVSRNGYH